MQIQAFLSLSIPAPSTFFLVSHSDWNCVSNKQRHKTNPHPERDSLKSCYQHTWMTTWKLCVWCVGSNVKSVLDDWYRQTWRHLSPEKFPLTAMCTANQSWVCLTVSPMWVLIVPLPEMQHSTFQVHDHKNVTLFSWETMQLFAVQQNVLPSTVCTNIQEYVKHIDHTHAIITTRHHLHILLFIRKAIFFCGHLKYTNQKHE